MFSMLTLSDLLFHVASVICDSPISFKSHYTQNNEKHTLPQ